MDLNLGGRRALITGGSKGIGMAVAEELVAEGVHVAMCARHPDELAAAAEKLRGSGCTVYAQVADVTELIKTGDELRVDPADGVVEILSRDI